MANPALARERPPPPGSSVTAPPQRADEIFLEGLRSRFDELVEKMGEPDRAVAALIPAFKNSPPHPRRSNQISDNFGHGKCTTLREKG